MMVQAEQNKKSSCQQDANCNIAALTAERIKVSGGGRVEQDAGVVCAQALHQEGYSPDHYIEKGEQAGMKVKLNMDICFSA